MEKKILIERRPDYFHGQLLLEDDFRDEQAYHRSARYRHNLELHGWGVVHGLEVVRKDEATVTVEPGFAIDNLGRELSVNQAVNLDVTPFGPNDLVKFALSYEEEAEGHRYVERKRRDCFATLTACRMSENVSALTLATVQLDAEAKIQAPPSYDNTKYACAVLGAGSVTAAALHPQLRYGWFKMPFRPMAIPEGDFPPGVTEIPAFRVGVTRAISPDPREAGSKDRGAGGTMAIPLPPGVRILRNFRIAGEHNDDKIAFQLFLGGWNEEDMKHVRQELLNETIDTAPYSKTYPVPEHLSAIDPEFHTLALTLRGTRRTSVSLVAVELGY